MKTLQLTKILGEIVRELRKSTTDKSCTKLADEFNLGRGNLNRIENGVIFCKFITIWKVAEALDMKPSNLVKMLEEKLGEDFKLIDE